MIYNQFYLLLDGYRRSTLIRWNICILSWKHYDSLGPTNLSIDLENQWKLNANLMWQPTLSQLEQW
jgi:hypothetical protein